MTKSFAIFRSIACLICLFFLLGGCEKQAESTKKLQAVRKKIVIQKNEVQQPQTAKPRPSEPVQAVSEPVADIAKTAKPVTEPKATDEDKIPLESKELAAVNLKKPEKAEEEETGKIDPFAPLFKDEPVKKARRGGAKKVTKKRIPLTPLEKIDLSQLKLVGVIRAPSGNKALVEEASGKGYIVAQGTYIGLHAGRILEILSDRVIVEEEIEDILGKVTIVRKELKILKPPGEF